MKILYVGNFSDVSVGEPDVKCSLEELGHTVIAIDEFSTTCNELNHIIQREKVDFLLFAKFRVKNSPREKEGFFRNLEIPTVCWIWDLYFGL